MSSKQQQDLIQLDRLIANAKLLNDNKQQVQGFIQKQISPRFSSVAQNYKKQTKRINNLTELGKWGEERRRPTRLLNFLNFEKEAILSKRPKILSNQQQKEQTLQRRKSTCRNKKRYPQIFNDPNCLGNFNLKNMDITEVARKLYGYDFQSMDALYLFLLLHPNNLLETFYDDLLDWSKRYLTNQNIPPIQTSLKISSPNKELLKELINELKGINNSENYKVFLRKCLKYPEIINQYARLLNIKDTPISLSYDEDRKKLLEGALDIILSSRKGTKVQRTQQPSTTNPDLLVAAGGGGPTNPQSPTIPLRGLQSAAETGSTGPMIPVPSGVSAGGQLITSSTSPSVVSERRKFLQIQNIAKHFKQLNQEQIKRKLTGLNKTADELKKFALKLNLIQDDKQKQKALRQFLGEQASAATGGGGRSLNSVSGQQTVAGTTAGDSSSVPGPKQSEASIEQGINGSPQTQQQVQTRVPIQASAGGGGSTQRGGSRQISSISTPDDQQTGPTSDNNQQRRGIMDGRSGSITSPQSLGLSQRTQRKTPTRDSDISQILPPPQPFDSDGVGVRRPSSVRGGGVGQTMPTAQQTSGSASVAYLKGPSEISADRVLTSVDSKTRTQSGRKIIQMKTEMRTIKGKPLTKQQQTFIGKNWYDTSKLQQLKKKWVETTTAGGGGGGISQAQERPDTSPLSGRSSQGRGGGVAVSFEADQQRRNKIKSQLGIQDQDQYRQILNRLVGLNNDPQFKILLTQLKNIKNNSKIKKDQEKLTQINKILTDIEHGTINDVLSTRFKNKKRIRELKKKAENLSKQVQKQNGHQKIKQQIDAWNSVQNQVDRLGLRLIYATDIKQGKDKVQTHILNFLQLLEQNIQNSSVSEVETIIGLLTQINDSDIVKTNEELKERIQKLMASLNSRLSAGFLQRSGGGIGQLPTGTPSTEPPRGTQQTGATGTTGITGPRGPIKIGEKKAKRLPTINQNRQLVFQVFNNKDDLKKFIIQNGLIPELLGFLLTNECPIQEIVWEVLTGKENDQTIQEFVYNYIINKDQRYPLRKKLYRMMKPDKIRQPQT